MSTRANQQLGQMGILGPMDIGADGRGHCWVRGGWGRGGWGREGWGLGFRVGGVGDGGVGVGRLIGVFWGRGELGGWGRRSWGRGVEVGVLGSGGVGGLGSEKLGSGG